MTLALDHVPCVPAGKRSELKRKPEIVDAFLHPKRTEESAKIVSKCRQNDTEARTVPEDAMTHLLLKLLTFPTSSPMPRFLKVFKNLGKFKPVHLTYRP